MKVKMFILCLLFVSIRLVSSNEITCGDVGTSQVETSSEECVGIKFPWKEEEVFFCPEKPYNYTTTQKHSQCSTATSLHYMTINGPWLKCPEILSTDTCESYTSYCGEVPFGRDCKVVSNPQLCCLDYYCGPGETWDDCVIEECPQVTDLEEQKYTTFKDNYSCCPAYQIHSDEKEGSCQNYDSNMDIVLEGTYWYYKYWKRQLTTRDTNGEESVYCIGDFNCPGTEKCCLDLTGYGYCTLPIQDEEVISL